MTADSRPLRVGVIGTGAMGGAHAENLHGRIVGAQLAGVMDADAARAAEVAARCGSVTVFRDPDELIRSESVDAVLIASTDDTHAGLVLECLRARKPVMCEKPLATSLADAREIVDAEKDLGRRLVQVGFCRRFDSQHLAIKREFESGALGRPLMYKGWHRNIGGGGREMSNELFLFGSAVHEFDSIRWFLGQELEEIYVKGVNTDPDLGEDVYDLLLFQLSLTDGCLATFDVYQSAVYGYEIGVELVGERGTALIGPPNLPVVRASGSYSARIEAHWLERLGQAYITEVQAWVASIESGAAVGANAWDGYMALLGSAYGLEALNSGAPQRVPVYERPDFYRVAAGG